MTKATDLKTKFLKSPWKMDVDTCVTLWYLFKTKTKKSLHFFDLFCHFFLSLPSNQTIKVIDLFYFNELALKNWALNISTLFKNLIFRKCLLLTECCTGLVRPMERSLGFAENLKFPHSFLKVHILKGENGFRNISNNKEYFFNC